MSERRRGDLPVASRRTGSHRRAASVSFTLVRWRQASAAGLSRPAEIWSSASLLRTGKVPGTCLQTCWRPHSSAKRCRAPFRGTHLAPIPIKPT